MLKFQVGDMVDLPRNMWRGHEYGVVVEIKEPHKDWRYESRLPNAGVAILWCNGPDAGTIKWKCYREVEKIIS